MITKFKNRLRAILQQGLTRKELAVSMTLGFLLGIFPLYGVTTLLIVFVAYRWKLNHAVMISVGYLFTPLLFVFWIPFIRVGELLFFFDPLPVSQSGLSGMLDQGFFHLLSTLSERLVLGIFGWIVFAPFGFFIAYRLSHLILGRFENQLPKDQSIS